MKNSIKSDANLHQSKDKRPWTEQFTFLTIEPSTVVDQMILRLSGGRTLSDLDIAIDTSSIKTRTSLNEKSKVHRDIQGCFSPYLFKTIEFYPTIFQSDAVIIRFNLICDNPTTKYIIQCELFEQMKKSRQFPRSSQYLRQYIDADSYQPNSFHPGDYCEQSECWQMAPLDQSFCDEECHEKHRSQVKTRIDEQFQTLLQQDKTAKSNSFIVPRIIDCFLVIIGYAAAWNTRSQRQLYYLICSLISLVLLIVRNGPWGVTEQPTHLRPRR